MGMWKTVSSVHLLLGNAHDREVSRLLSPLILWKHSTPDHMDHPQEPHDPRQGQRNPNKTSRVTCHGRALGTDPSSASNLLCDLRQDTAFLGTSVFYFTYLTNIDRAHVICLVLLRTL